MEIRTFAVSSVLLIGLGGPPLALAQGDGDDVSNGNGDNGTSEPTEFAETTVLIEINATDGDVGFHSLLDADAWTEARIYGPDGEKLFKEQAVGALAEQGLTENMFESEEPLCTPDPEEPDVEVVPLSAFIERFPEGTYTFNAQTREGEELEGTAELTFALPAAPDIVGFDGTTVTWQPGTDLGKCQDDGLVSDGTIPDPGGVELAGWEVVVEPADEEAVDPLRVFSVQLPAGAPNMVSVPAEFIDAYRAEDVTEFKVEVGAIEASGNRTFSEEEFALEPPDETDDTGESDGEGTTTDDGASS